MIQALILGPTGVGKTRLGQAWAKERALTFIDLDQQLQRVYKTPKIADALVQWGLPLFYQRSLALLQLLEQKTECLLIAVGAGTQLAAQGQLDLLNWPHLFLVAEASWLWQQNQLYRQDPRSLTDFCAIEFHPWREQLCQASQQILDITGLSQQMILKKALELN